MIVFAFIAIVAGVGALACLAYAVHLTDTKTLFDRRHNIKSWEDK